MSEKPQEESVHERVAHSALEKIRILETNVMMATGIFDEIREVLTAAGCMHGNGEHKDTPPMMFPQWIACCLAKARTTAPKAGADGEGAA